MFNSNGGYSLSDIAAVSGRNGGTGFGDGDDGGLFYYSYSHLMADGAMALAVIAVVPKMSLIALI
jgi:hypothetical protein